MAAGTLWGLEWERALARAVTHYVPPPRPRRHRRAPDHIADVMAQRLRWAMGALQILMLSNPLRLVGVGFGRPCVGQ